MKIIVKLIKEKKFNEIIKTEGDTFHKAYAYYRLFLYKKSLKILHNLKGTKRVKILMAQNYFYLLEFKKAYDLFAPYSDDEYVQFNMNCLLYFSRNNTDRLPEKYSIYPLSRATGNLLSLTCQNLAKEDQYNAAYQFLNDQNQFSRYVTENQSNELIHNQLMNLEGEYSKIKINLLNGTEQLIVQKNQGEKIILKNRRLFQNNYTFRKFMRRKNILKVNSMDHILGAFLDLRAGKDSSKHLEKIDGIFHRIFSVLFSNDEQHYRDIYDIIVTNL